MRHFAQPLNLAQSDAFLARNIAAVAEDGFGFWAVEDRATGAVAGMCGLQPVGFAAHFTPAVEIGWRFATAFQGRGLATEAARLALAEGFGRLALAEIVAFTVPANAPSRRLMERLGMVADGGFEHPGLPTGHPLRPHHLYRLGRERFLNAG